MVGTKACLIGLVGGFVLVAVAEAQAGARQATPEEAARIEKGPGAPVGEEVPNPMLLEVPLSATEHRRAIWEMEPGKAWVASETRRFVCDRARVLNVSVVRGKEKKGKVPLTITPLLTSEWYRQDVDLTIVLESDDGKPLGKRTWGDLTIGNSGGPYAGRTKTPDLELNLPVATWNRELADGRQPRIKILLEIQSEEGDEDDD